MTGTPQPPESPGRRRLGSWIVGGLMVLVTIGVVVALLTSQLSGTGAENVGSSGDAAPTAEGQTAEGECPVTKSNPGGTNNYIPDAPEGEDLGDGFVIRGMVRSAEGCVPLEGVRIQIWLATETGSESDNRTSVRTDNAGRYRVETAPTIAQFGEPNIHVGYDDGKYESVFIRRVVDLEDDTATIDLNLQPTP